MNVKKILFVSAGVAALILGVIGIVFPILPTTPFLLLTLYCFAKGSGKLNVWIQETSLYKKYLEQYVQIKSLSLKQKLSIQFLANGMMINAFVFSQNPILRVVLVACCIAHNWVIMFKIKTR